MIRHSVNKIAILASISLLFVSGGLSSANAETQTPSRDLVAICGDSITAQRYYSVFLEDYLLMCEPLDGRDIAQYGCGGETAAGLLARQKYTCLNFKPTFATICYGMNDASYMATDPVKLKTYTESLTGLVTQFRDAGVRKIVVGSPGAVDVDFCKRFDPNVYNQTLADFTAGAKRVAAEQGVAFADVHGTMMEAMSKSKAKYGKGYAFVGAFDGVHPGPAGHLVMAYAFLKALGFDGEIGTITIDLKNNSATATSGHKIISSDNGVVEVESTRYPFCFYGNPAEPTTASIIEFIPFNEELNRYKLVVKNVGSPKLKVTWGSASCIYKAEDMQKGINLAAEFLDNPFSAPFAKTEAVIREQQTFEVNAKAMLCSLEEFRKLAPDDGDSIKRLEQRVIEKDLELRQHSRATVQPVKHTIRIERSTE